MKEDHGLAPEWPGNEENQCLPLVLSRLSFKNKKIKK